MAKAKNDNKTVSFYFSGSLEERIKVASDIEKRSKNQIAEMVVEAGLKKLGW